MNFSISWRTCTSTLSMSSYSLQINTVDFHASKHLGGPEEEKYLSVMRNSIDIAEAETEYT